MCAYTYILGRVSYVACAVHGPMVNFYPLWNIGVAKVIELGYGFVTQQAFVTVHR